MSNLVRYALFGIGGVAAVATSFLTGLYLFFPADLARDRIVYEFDKSNEPEFAIEIEDLSLWRLTGVELENVQLLSLKRGKRGKDTPKPAMEATPVLSVSNLALRAQVLPLVLGQKAISFAADIAGGTLEGVFSTSDALTKISLDAQGLDLSQSPIESGETLLKLTGTLSATADLSLNTEELKESKGTLKIQFQGLGLGEGSKASGFGLPAVTFSKSELLFEVKDGKLVVTSGAFESDSLNATISGDISLNKKLARSRNRLELAFTLPSDLDELARLSPDLKRARDEDGSYHANISGTVLSPSFRLSRKGSVSTSISRPSAIGDTSMGAGEGSIGTTSTADMSDEERRAAREKRIAERRERLRKRREEMDARKGGTATTGTTGEGEEGPTGGNEPFMEPGDFPSPDELGNPGPPDDGPFEPVDEGGGEDE